MANHGGRPGKLTPKVKDRIVEAVSTGLTYELAAEYGGISYATFALWMRRGRAEFERLEADPEAKPSVAERKYLKFFNEIREVSTQADMLFNLTIFNRATIEPQWAAWMLAKRHPEQYGTKQPPADDANSAQADSKPFSLPAHLIAGTYCNPYRDIREHRHTEYVFYGGRGSTKSTFISLAIIERLINNPQMHAIACRQVANTLRDSVYAQIMWAIIELDLLDQFKCITSPLEMTYIPTGQKIYFRGADDPGKIKSIKPSFGYIGLAWFEELDQFTGPEAIRKIEQSVIRGGDLAYIFKSFNPPRTANNWANKYVKVPKESQYQHASTYLDVPAEWLGKPWLDEAEHLKAINPAAYEHEYLGVPNGVGGLVFENVKLRQITAEEIKQFDQVKHGLDWGFYPDPAAYNRMHYDAARLTLYIFGEFRGTKLSNRLFWDALVKQGVRPNDLIIADSAEPKSIADFLFFGANIRGAEKGPDSVDYSMKWLQSLREIVIDPERCPETATEFLDYTLEQDKNGEFISQYPDKNNHQIDAVRYATNLIWRRPGR